MKQKMRKKVYQIAWLCAFVYFVSYLLRMNFNVMLVKICSEMGVGKTALAVVMTGLTVFYGSGQLVNGILGDKISPHMMIIGGLAAASLCNIGMYFAQSIPVMTVIWCINGFANAMLWAPIVKLFSLYLTDGEYSFAMMRVMWGSSFSTVFLRILCPLLLFVMSWRTVMLILAVVGVAVTVVYAFLHRRVFSEPVVFAKKEGSEEEQTRTVPLPHMVYLPLALILVAIVMHGMLKDGVANWMPSFLLETFHMPEENAIFATILLAVFGMVSFSFFDFLHRRFFKNEITCSTVCFISALAAAALLYLSNTLGGPVFISMLLMAIITASMSGVNLMLITVVPKRFVKSGKISTFTGLLDAFAYVGSGISAYGFAALAESFGWNVTILIWALIALAGILFCLVAAPLWKRFRKEYADNPSV